MEAKAFDIDIKTISRELVCEGYTKKVYCKNYWNSHGTKVWQADTQYAFDREKKFELYREVREYNFEYVPKQTFEFLLLDIEGERFDVGEITSFRELKTKVKLECCIGAG
jgi:hypothetical protein